MNLAAALLCLAFATGDGWKQHTAPFTARLPSDHGSHAAFRSEWWYATGELTSEAGERFGYQLTIFRAGLEPGLPEPNEPYWSPRMLYAGHLALTEMGAQKTRSAQRLGRANGALAGAREGELDAWVGDWRIARDPASGLLHASGVAREIGVALELDLRPTKALVQHGPDGLSPKGTQPGNASAYLSYTRLATQGRMTLDSRALAVRGESWFDHEWGSSQLGEGVVGWDWFGLRLDDGRELMLYRMRKADGSVLPISSGTLVRADGTTRALLPGELQLSSDAQWTSPRSQGVYPARWKLAIASEKLELRITPRVPDCEIDGARSTGVVYWEGPVAVEGSSTGSGYAELTGYAGSLAGRF